MSAAVPAALPSPSGPSFATKAAKVVVSILRNPLGNLALTAGLMQLTGPFAGLVQRWGVNGLANFLDSWTGPDFTEADVDAHLSRMVTVPVYSPSELWERS